MTPLDCEFYPSNGDQCQTPRVALRWMDGWMDATMTMTMARTTYRRVSARIIDVRGDDEEIKKSSIM